MTLERDMPAAPADPSADRYLDIWERNLAEIARRGPPDPPRAPAPAPTRG